MRSCRLLISIVGVSALSLWGCSGNDVSSAGPTGGSNSAGNSNAGGGATASGGVAGLGGGVSTGGSNALGGSSGTGGSNALGGSSGTGGLTASGGVIGTGGNNATGGALSTGGSKATGGATNTGGAKATGGLGPTGGTSASGGSKATGGNKLTGGASSAGGVSSVGGGSTVNCSGTAGSASCPEGVSSMCGMLAAHNAVRAAVTDASPPLPPLVWDCTLAAFAQAWASTCPADHNPNRTVEGQTAGENMAFFSASTLQSPATVVNLWAAEGANYTYSTNTCASGQVVRPLYATRLAQYHRGRLRSRHRLQRFMVTNLGVRLPAGRQLRWTETLLTGPSASAA